MGNLHNKQSVNQTVLSLFELNKALEQAKLVNVTHHAIVVVIYIRYDYIIFYNDVIGYIHLGVIWGNFLGEGNCGKLKIYEVK